VSASDGTNVTYTSATTTHAGTITAWLRQNSVPALRPALGSQSMLPASRFSWAVPATSRNAETNAEAYPTDSCGMIRAAISQLTSPATDPTAPLIDSARPSDSAALADASGAFSPPDGVTG